MTISSNLFEAFLKCPTKCWLRANGEPASDNAYTESVEAQDGAYRARETERLLSETPKNGSMVVPPAENLKAGKWRLAIGTVVQAQVNSYVLESELHAIERRPSKGRSSLAQFIPIRFMYMNKLGADDKLLLAFDAFLLSGMMARATSLGKIIYGDNHAVLKLKTGALAGEVRRRVEKISALLGSPSPPELILNRHCGECEFQSRCRLKAVEKDDLSLLAGMSEKERQKFHSKGIFTVTQLSYTFRPRRRPKRMRDKQEKYHHSLKALAIREKKIHIVGNPELKIEGTPVYLDVEGLPDRGFYYLIGLRVGNDKSAVQHSLWADTVEDEVKIWREFLGILETLEKPVLIHYGSYETTFLRRMIQQYGAPEDESVAAKAIGLAINLLSFIFAKVYFPCLGNGLKEIAGYLGFRWSDSAATGLRTVVWRQEWQATKAFVAKQALLNYNAEDCQALEVVTRALLEIGRGPTEEGPCSPGHVVNVANQKREHPYGFKRNTFAFPQLDAVNKAAYWDYQRERVYVKSNQHLSSLVRATRSTKLLSPDKIIECGRARSCPKCNSSHFFGHGRASKTVIDLRFMHHGLKRWIVQYRFHRYKCQTCGATFYPQGRCWVRSPFGPELMAYALYLNIELRLPQTLVTRNLNKLFGFRLPVTTTTNAFKERGANMYLATYEALVKRLCSGELLHVDETKISIRGNEGFVWVFANMKAVAYIYSETREGDFVRTMLKDFKGVLVSDFYAAYDAIQCPQQKCLIHLIRDLNDDVLKRPYDEEFRQLAQAFALLLKPMIASVDRHGLKSRFLKKHLVSVERFYRKMSKTSLQSDTAVKFKERLEKNRDKLFTFLSYDNIPWNNNNAEHAVKAFAALRRVIGGVTTEKGVREYLVLLSLCETCRYMGLDYLDFLRSGEKDIQAFASVQRGRRRWVRVTATSPSPSPLPKYAT
jgi:predicted RecB family nuclease